jgi:uncharacterized paraquat-inducible protein A
VSQSDKELADKLDAQDRLRARGYEKVACEKCDGLGLEGFDIACSRCGGKGYHWRAPLTK